MSGIIGFSFVLTQSIKPLGFFKFIPFFFTKIIRIFIILIDKQQTYIDIAFICRRRQLPSYTRGAYRPTKCSEVHLCLITHHTSLGMRTQTCRVKNLFFTFPLVAAQHPLSMPFLYDKECQKLFNQFLRNKRCKNHIFVLK